jgi:hypothetical protein
VTYRDTVLADNPLHYWEMPPGGGQVFQDLGSRGNPMVQVASMNSGYAGPWDGGLAIACNGASRARSDDAVLQAAPVSVEAWVWVYSFGGAVASILDWDGATPNQLILYMTAARFAQFQAGGVTIVAPAILTTHAWHHLVGTYTGGNLALWIDNVNVVNGGGGAALGGGALRWQIANDVANGSPFNGMIASCAVYGAALNAGQIAAHYAAANDKTVFPEYIASPPGGFTLISGSPPSFDVRLLQSIWDAVHKVIT